jgi:hypothetical protein
MRQSRRVHAIRTSASRRRPGSNDMHLIRTLGAALACTGLVLGSAWAEVPSCSRHLSVELTPGVSNPRDLAFLSSLLTMPGYLLAWRGQNGSAIELELSGRGPEDGSRSVIAAMRKDARVQSITVSQD